MIHSYICIFRFKLVMISVISTTSTNLENNLPYLECLLLFDKGHFKIFFLRSGLDPYGTLRVCISCNSLWPILSMKSAAGNHGNCTHQNKCPIQDGEYYYDDSLPMNLIEGIGHRLRTVTPKTTTTTSAIPTTTLSPPPTPPTPAPPPLSPSTPFDALVYYD